jgi:radical SAM protein with 4Fe4S-binding SPASM domain
MNRQNIQNLPQILQFIEAEEIQHACFSHSPPDADDAPATAEIRSALRTIADATLRWNHLGSQCAIFTTGQPADGAYFWMMMRRRDAKRAEAIWRSLRHPSTRKVPAPPGIARIDHYGNVRLGPSHPDRILGNLKAQPFREIWERQRRSIGAPDLANFQRCTNCRFQEICEWESPERPLTDETDLAPVACYLRSYEIAVA